MTMLTRRFFLSASGAAVTALSMPRMAFARANTNRRFVFIIQRGAADGLSILGPTGDPQHASIRGDFDQDLRNGTKLGSFFTLHPALAQAAKMYADRQALFVHAVASPYRDRSHFDGQNVLETGGSAAYQLKDGWLNRLLGLLPAGESRALALSDTVPMALRGSNQVSSYAPSKLQGPNEDLLQRVSAMYDSDRQLHALWSEAVATRMTAGDVEVSGQNGAAIGSVAAKLLAGDSGARIGMIETNGWDTHSGQRGRLSAQLKNLDGIVSALKSGLGPDWANTLILVATEFGRTVRPNGTAGTDHGEGSLAMLFGGAVAGGKVIADWPGLATAALYDGRDLKPTTQLDALVVGALSQHFGLESSRVLATLFPESRGNALARPLIA
jgi:uncharacterized protein (DUF1501 family)